MMPLATHPSERTRPIPVIGIVGGVGSGKSSVAKALADRVAVAIIDADKLGHLALELPAVKESLRRRFGDAIFAPDGMVIRSQLAKRVFGDDASAVAARKDLEAITHPEIGRLADERIAEIRRENAVRWIVLDAALLLEAAWSRHCDLIAFIDVPEEMRIDRVMRNRKWSREEWERREASQWPVAKKRAAADVVISNAGEVQGAAAELHKELEHRLN